MRIPCFFLLVAVLSIVTGSSAAANDAGDWTAVRSPGRVASIAVRVAKTANGVSQLTYRVKYRGKIVIAESRLGLDVSGPADFGSNPRIESIDHQSIDRKISLPLGKNNPTRDRFSETRVHLVNAQGHRWELTLRAYDEGVAFRYHIAKQPKLKQITVRSERTEFNLTDQPTVHFLTADGFKSAHEGPYREARLADLPTRKLIDLPSLFVRPDGGGLAITEARLRDFPGMYLWRDEASSTNLQVKLSPLPGEKDKVALVQSPLDGPWRVVMLADHPGKLMENNMVVLLNDPSAMDASWVKPGKST